MNVHLDIVILGLSITSSWGNGHATTYRGLVRELVRRGHRVLFLERDEPWYADNRDMPEPPFGRTVLYPSLDELRRRYADAVRAADLVVVGSYVPEGIAVGNWVTEHANGISAFYDIDTPVTLSGLASGECEYLTPELIPRYDLYLSFSGGRALQCLEQEYDSPRARPLYCSFDREIYRPAPAEPRYDLGYMGTYSDDRQPPLKHLMLSAAEQWPHGRFVVAGPQYPGSIQWPENLERIDHLPPARHRAFYNSQRFTLNITRADMIRMGHSPSVRLFEAAACGTPIISDWWEGLDEFFTPGEEILISRGPAETLYYLRELPETRRRAIATRARKRVLSRHTAAHRAAELEGYVLTLLREHASSNPAGGKPAWATRSKAT